ncbi:MAG: PTS sugar transporter subunit IIA [Desulfurococcaceae archaeon]|jgi:PTS system galactitol-specific IIA component
MDIFVLNVNASDRYELLYSLAKKLHELGYVKDTYLKALINREENYPTGLVVNERFHVAIPHADVEHVEKEALVVVKTHRRITFRKMDEPSVEIPVDAVFLLVIKEPKGYVKFLAALTNLFTNEEFIKIILNGAPNEIEEYLKKNLLIFRW